MNFHCEICSKKLIFEHSIEFLICKSCGKAYSVDEVRDQCSHQDEIDYLTTATKVNDRIKNDVCIYCGSAYNNIF